MNKQNLAESIGNNLFKIAIAIGLVTTVLYVYGVNRPTQQAKSNLSEFEPIINPIAVFYTDVIATNLSKTYLEFQYSFDSPQEVWLTLQTQEDADPIIILVNHPKLIELNWPKIQNQSYTLFQKQSNITDIQEFPTTIPESAKIIADPSLIYQGTLFPRPQQVQPLSVGSNLEDVDYVITTFRTTQSQNGVYTFSRVIDASSAVISECPEDTSLDCRPQLIWKFDLPGVSEENQFYLNNIQIDYRQDSVDDLPENQV